MDNFVDKSPEDVLAHLEAQRAERSFEAHMEVNWAEADVHGLLKSGVAAEDVIPFRPHTMAAVEAMSTWMSIGVLDSLAKLLEASVESDRMAHVVKLMEADHDPLEPLDLDITEADVRTEAGRCKMQVGEAEAEFDEALRRIAQRFIGLADRWRTMTAAPLISYAAGPEVPAWHTKKLTTLLAETMRVLGPLGVDTMTALRKAATADERLAEKFEVDAILEQMTRKSRQ